jgi:hypothetical protein
MGTNVDRMQPFNLFHCLATAPAELGRNMLSLPLAGWKFRGLKRGEFISTTQVR